MDKKEEKNSGQIIIEKRIWNMNNFFIALILGVVIVFSFFIILWIFQIDILKRIVLACFFIVAYAITLFFLLEPKILREIRETNVKTIETPVVKEVIVEKPVVQQIPYETEKTIYITREKPRKKLNIPKYSYIGSFKTKVYHKKSCRLGKLIKKKYKVLNNNIDYFTKNNYRPCEVCIKHSVKV